jgi:flagellar P-ring protein FlgI
MPSSAGSQRLPVKIVPTEARVQINTKTGTIIITGDVEISPVVISHKGLSISTINPPPVPSPRAPVIESRDVIEGGHHRAR